MKRLPTLLLAGSSWLLLHNVTLRAQDAADSALPSTNAPTAGDLSAAIAQKEAEIAALKKQLAQAKGEIKNLSATNQKLQNSDTTLKTEIQTAGPDLVLKRPDPAPLTGTPDAATPMDSVDLFWYYHNSPAPAAQDLTGKPISVNGKIIGFAAPIMSRVFGIELESGDPNLRVICRFVVPRIYSTVVFRRKTGEILGRTSAGNDDLLLTIGDVITVEGKCQGLDDGDVALANCRLVL